MTDENLSEISFQLWFMVRARRDYATFFPLAIELKNETIE